MSLVPRQSGGMPWTPPAPSPDLRSWLDLVEGFPKEWLHAAAQGAHGVYVPKLRAPMTAALHAEAVALLPVYRAAAEGPSPDFMRSWLKPLAVAVRNPPPQEQLGRVAGVYAMLMADLPWVVFTDQAMRAGAQRWDFWPSVADVTKLVRDEAEEVLQRRDVLAYIAAMAPPA